MRWNSAEVPLLLYPEPKISLEIETRAPLRSIELRGVNRNMSYTESPIQTFIKFDKNIGWKNSPEKVLTSDFLSANGESNLLWTPFYYEEKDNKLYDPVRDKFVAGSASGDKIEEGVITQVQEWFLSHDSGLGIWISPRGDGKRPYEDEQITIYRIAYKNIDADKPLQKVLLFGWHQFQTEFRNPEDIRKFIFTEDDKEESVFEIINWLKNISQKPVADSYGDIEKRIQQASNYAHLYKSGTDIYELTYKMDQTKFLGQNPIGCPPGTTTTNSSYTENVTSFLGYAETSWHDGTCRVCGISTWVGPCSICKPCEAKL